MPQPWEVPKTWSNESGFWEYKDQLPEKKGASPKGWGEYDKKLSQTTRSPREAGIATWIKWPAQAKELTPNNTYRKI